MTLSLRSPAFQEGQEIPKQFTGEGSDRSPRLAWSGAPSGTREFALICEDPDAPVPTPWVHWLIYNLSASTHLIPEGVEPVKRVGVPVRAHQGINSFGHVGYGGPMPPVGHGRHRYIFKLYALDSELNLKPGATKEELQRAMRGHVLAEAHFTGTYERRQEKIPAA
jgi:Raf kinase inhibitor-like YbhB/YbcL family protein